MASVHEALGLLPSRERERQTDIQRQRLEREMDREVR
jgi:hypothetical protein